MTVDIIPCHLEHAGWFDRLYPWIRDRQTLTLDGEGETMNVGLRGLQEGHASFPLAYLSSSYFFPPSYPPNLDLAAPPQHNRDDHTSSSKHSQLKPYNASVNASTFQ